MLDEKEIRKVYFNSTAQNKFCSNIIKTAKYNWFTFLPLAIAYQFNNYFNIYFLFTAVILAIKTISPMDPGTAIGPFIFVIMISVVREGLEDYKKSKFDNIYNNSITTRLNLKTNKEEQTKWNKIRVGEILKIKKNQVIPADLLIIKSSLSNGFCYMQTTNLDGESALKAREALHLFKTVLNFKENQHLIATGNEPNNSLSNLNEFEGRIELDEPNSNIYQINGKIAIWEKINSENQEIPVSNSFFTIDNILLRGTTLKNVDYAYGIVLYTGKDTKIARNIQKGSLKISSIQKTLNKVVIVVIIIVCSMCVGCTMFGMIVMAGNFPDMSKDKQGAYYIYVQQIAYTYNLEFFQLFGAFFIIFNNIIPISLTITFEIAKGLQVLYIEADKKLYNEEEGENFKCLSLKLQEDLGNVRYIFTDKTGTLTKNEMIFRACSIYSKLFFNLEDKKPDEDNNGYENSPNPIDKKIFSNLFNLEEIKYYLHSELPIELKNIENSYYKSARDVVVEFFLNIALNHNILTETDADTGITTFQGSNPDEVALVTAAKEIGIEYVSRVGPIITVAIDNNTYLFEVLQKFEFSSERARSSIIVKNMATDEIKLFIKGSDEKILPLSDPFSKDNLEETTNSHLDIFAKNGLRTLCYGVKNLDEKYYRVWDSEFKTLKNELLTNPSKSVEYENKISQIEKNCILIGVSGLEDKLQDDVKETIQEFIDAGIQMWMITGDKLDTAESIGYSSKLFDEQTEIFKIRNNSTKDEVQQAMVKILEEMNSMEEELRKLKLERKRKKKKKKTIDDGHIYIREEKNLELKSKKDKSKHPVVEYDKAYPNSENGKNSELIFDQKIKKIQKEENYKIGSLTPNIRFKTIQKYPLPNPPKYGLEMDLGKSINGRNMKTLILSRKHSENTIERIDKDLDLPKSDIIINSSQDLIKSNNSSIIEIDHFDLESEADDISIFKFMIDKNFFEASLMNKKEFAHTFVNKIIQLAGTENVLSLDSIRMNAFDQKNENDDNIRFEQDNFQLAIKQNDQVEEVDISNLYDYYVGELNKMKKKKDDLRSFLKFTNLDFYNKKDKKTEDQINDINEYKLLNFGLIIEGSAVSMCLTDELKPTFWKLIKKASGIVCCRCTPIQKSDIVSFVKDKSGEVCLAIGDGGNDVNMIKVANVGVGIFGREGYQAAYSSDYAISQFKYLKRLLFCHGRLSLRRNSYFIYFFFFKSLMFYVPNLWFSFFSEFSGTLLWDNLYFVLYSSILTTAPPTIFMVYDEDFDYEFEGHSNKEVLQNLIPDIYKEYRESSPFNSLKFFIVFMLGIIHSSVIYFAPVFVFKFGQQDNLGRPLTLWDQSMAGCLTILIVQYCIIFEDTYLYNYPVIIAHSIQIFINIMFFVMYGLLGTDQLGAYTFDIVSNLQFWFTLIIIVVVAVSPIVISRRVDNMFLNNIINNLSNGNFEDDSLKKIYTKKIEHMSRCTRSIFKFKKFLNEKREYEPDNYVDKKMKDFVELYRINRKAGKKTNQVKESPNRIIRAKSVDIKTNFFKSLQSINLKIRNSKNKFLQKDVKDMFSIESSKAADGGRKERRSNSRKETESKKLNLNKEEDNFAGENEINKMP